MRQVIERSDGRPIYRNMGLGHLVTLADRRTTIRATKEWKMEDLPMLPNEFSWMSPNRRESGTSNAVKTQLYRE